MTTTQGRLESIYPALLAIVNNIAPNVRDLQRATSSKLLDLFISMSSPSFLLEKEPNHQLLMQLLQAMDAILEYQAAGRSSSRFFVLPASTLEGIRPARVFVNVPGARHLPLVQALTGCC